MLVSSLSDIKITTVFSYAATDHSMHVSGWTRPPAPRQVVLARDKLRAECVLSAVPVPGIEITVHKRLLSL